MFEILSRCDSIAETCEGLKGTSRKLNHSGMQKTPARNSAGTGLRNRSDTFFEALYYELTGRYKGFLSGTAERWGLTVKELYIVDSTTIGSLVIHSKE